MSLLVLALAPEPLHAPALEFLRLVGSDVVDAGRVPATDLPHAPGQEVVALAPPGALSWHAVQLPAGVGPSSGRLRAVLEGLLEDQLLDPPGELHLALAGPKDPDSHWVVACDRRWLAVSVQALEVAGCPPLRVVPEWPAGVARWHLTGTPERPQMVVCNAQGVSLLTLSQENVAWALPPQARAGLALTADPELLSVARAHAGPQVQPWARHERWALAAQAGWDLARGLRLRSQAQRSPLQWFKAPRWQAARWATVGLAAVQLAGLNALAWRQNVQLQAQREQMRQTLVQTFGAPAPHDARPPLAQMQHGVERLRAASAQASRDDLAVMLGAVVPALPDAGNPQGLSYSTGQLRLQGLALAATEVQSLDRALKPLGYSVQLVGADLLVRAAQ